MGMFLGYSKKARREELKLNFSISIRNEVCLHFSNPNLGFTSAFKTGDSIGLFRPTIQMKEVTWQFIRPQ